MYNYSYPQDKPQKRCVFLIMLHIITSQKELAFAEIKRIYCESILEQGSRDYMGFPENQRLLEAERDFYFYLKDFLKQKDSFLALWAPEKTAVAALRCEPYRDGFLIEGLETAPDSRNRGYASCLLGEVLGYLYSVNPAPVYSHILKHNLSSLRVHEKCGFKLLSDMAVYIDGSADFRCNTYCYKK